MFTPRSGSMTSNSASRTARTAAVGGSSVATEGADEAAADRAAGGGGGGRAAEEAAADAGGTAADGGGTAGEGAAGWVVVAWRPEGCRTRRTWQVGLWIQSATPWALRRTRMMSSAGWMLLSGTSSRSGRRPAASAWAG